ncbi:hypothetical protein L1987_43085 [Smallanthus sonchifolius]|uniref:Uncharacterized protein n=1 Tax=Smallanthus sonchifolius TaxID=185202 RepID=A0ACB9GKP1_9ASTR|nr:hypothetical protein L1987_43085 [Smallanthus sonchifolius]
MNIWGVIRGLWGLRRLQGWEYGFWVMKVEVKLVGFDLGGGEKEKAFIVSLLFQLFLIIFILLDFCSIYRPLSSYQPSFLRPPHLSAAQASSAALKPRPFGFKWREVEII